MSTIGENNSDGALGAILATSPWGYYGIHHPSIVQHRGGISSIFVKGGLSRERTSGSYKGDDFDVSRLPHWSEGRDPRFSDPARIKPTLAAIEEIWRKMPDNPLGKVLSVVANSKEHLASLEDDELVQLLRQRFTPQGE